MTNPELIKALERTMTIIAVKVLLGGMAIGMLIGWTIGAFG
jgi:hypothetical protein